MDHPALFNAVKNRDLEQLHKVLGPTLEAFGSNRVVYWDHAQEGILTSLGSLPGLQGYNCLRWAESVVSDSHQRLVEGETDSHHAEYVYRLRANLLGKAMERINELNASEKPTLQDSVTSAISALSEELAANPLKEDWFKEIQNRVKEVQMAANT